MKTQSKALTTLKRILTEPTIEDLWRFHADLLELEDSESVRKAREVAGWFYGFLSSHESKSASHTASRMGAVLATAAVTSIGLQEMLAEQQNRLRRLAASGITAALEVGSAAKHAQAWELEASLMYHENAWRLYADLWQIVEQTMPEAELPERRRFLDSLLEPLRDTKIDQELRAGWTVVLFQAALAARVQPLIDAWR